MVDEIAQELAKELNITIEEAQAAVVERLNRKIPTKEEIDKLLGENNMTPKWKMDGARESLLKLARRLVFDENGYLLSMWQLRWVQAGRLIGIISFKFHRLFFEDKTTFINNLQKQQPSIFVTPWFPSTFATDFKTNVAPNFLKTLALQVLPAALELERWNNFITGIEGAVNNVDLTINPSMSTDTFEAILSPYSHGFSRRFCNTRNN